MIPASSHRPEESRASSQTIVKDSISKKARFFANMVTLLWFYYGIGTWYGSHFVFEDKDIGPDPGIILGATLAVWFVSFFVSVTFYMVKKSR